VFNQVTEIENDFDPNLSRQTNLTKSVSRLAAVQIMYQLSMTDTSVVEVINHYESLLTSKTLDESMSMMAAPDTSFVKDLVIGTYPQIESIDEIITKYLDESWSIDRIDVLLLNILRCGVYEIKDALSVPPKVVISEYLSISDAFYDSKISGLVNAVLDKVVNDLRPIETN
jgi:N utilization substance protein B